MAKEREHHLQGRMLFTDLDASDKGRPAAALDDVTGDVFAVADGENYLNTPIPSIEDLAATIGLVFEDDWGEQEGEEPAFDAWSPSGGDGDDDFLMPPPPPSAAEPDDPEEELAKIPTWEEYTRALRQASQPSKAERPTEHYRREAPVYEPDEDEELDILSALPPVEDAEEERVHRPYEGEWRGQRLGVAPPRATPYGGIHRIDEWYRPPEEAEEEHAPPEAVEDWYEPPEDGAATATPSAEESPADDQAAKRHGGTHRLDMFSDLDLEALWQEKLAAARGAPSRHSTRRHNAAQDMFDEIDLDALWAERQRRASSGRSPGKSGRLGLSGADGADDAAMTQILGRDALDGASTIIMDNNPFADIVARNAPPPEAPERKKSARKSSPPSEKTKKRPRPKPAVPASESGSDALDFLDDLDSFFDDAGGDVRDVAAPAIDDDLIAGMESKSGPPRPHPSTIEELDIADLVADADDDPAAASEPEEDGNGVVPGVLPPQIDFGDLAADPSPPPSDEAEESYLPADAGEGGGDFMDAMDVDDGEPAVNADVAAPVIDDGDIAEVPPSPFDEEEIRKALQPVRSPREKAGEAEGDDDVFDGADDGEPAGEDSGEEGEAAPEEEAVAVDPMDVFANMDDMDFSDDGLDDEMRAMLDDEETGEDAGESEGSAASDRAAEAEAVPTGWKGKLRFHVRRVLRRVLPMTLIEKIKRMIAWRENWWFYCDLFAAIIASASLAVIISYYIWYRG